MSSFRGLGLSLSNEEAAPATLALAQEADRLGFDEVSIPESRQFRRCLRWREQCWPRLVRSPCE